MPDMEQPQIINLGAKEISPEDEAAYREKIKAAKAGTPLSALKSQTPIGGVERPQMPVFQQAKERISAAPEQGVSPRPAGSPPMRPETKAAVEAAVAAGAQQEQAAAAQKELDENRLKEEARLAEVFDSFDFGGQAREVERILDNKKRRKEIEDRCKPMDFEDLLMKDEVQQRVPIIPGKFEPLFRSLRPVESLYIKQKMAKETITTDQYLGEKYNLLLLTCSLVDISGAALPDHRKMLPDGSFEVDDKSFDEKLKRVMQKSGYIIADLGVNYVWFDIRVRKLINPEALGNG